MGRWGEWGRGCGWILKVRLVQISLFAVTVIISECFSERWERGGGGGVNVEYKAKQQF